ncbi:VaFE repeat-containing surface-anchored protein [Microbacterium sp. NPDC055903]
MSTDIKRGRGKWGRALSALLLIAAAVIPTTFATAASADEIEAGDTVWVGGDDIGYGGTKVVPVYSPVPADTGNPGLPDLWAYCIEHDVSMRQDTSATAGEYSSYLGDNYFSDPAVQAKVYWIITHSYPAISLAELGAAAGVPNLSANDAVEATQYAIWRYTDLTWDAEWNWETQASEDVYWHLLEGANADTATAPPTSAEVEVSITAPTGAGTAGELYGPFIVTTNQPTVSVSADPAFAIVDAAGDPVDTDAVIDGQELYLDLTGEATAGSATIAATANGASGTGLIISTPVVGSPTATPESHRQSLILVAAEDATTTASAEGNWIAAAVPTIGTTLVDAADDDHNLVWNGGTVIDTIAYTGLTPGQQYTVAGELMLQSDGSATGIEGSTTFTPTVADGSVEVTFTVPSGYAGDALVAFEYLYEGATATGTPVAEHTDIEDEAQTVTVDEEPVVVVPTIGTTLVDSADDDHNLVWNGGTVIDTIAHTGLTVGQQYTVAGELMLQADGSATGLTGSTTFTPTAADGTVEVTFTVPTGYAGDALVAFEYLYEGATAEGEPVAEHTDIEDAAQTVTVDEEPVVVVPSIGTSLVDSADDDHNLVWNGGTVIDTVAYQNLTPGTEYTVSGELMLQADGSATGITGSTTFTPTEANGTVDVTFIVPTGHAGDILVAFEYLYEGATAEGEPVAEHTDIEDAAQTVTVNEQPVTTVETIATTLVDSADDDHNLVWNGGTVIDTIAYTGLTPGQQYTVTGELMLQTDGSATGLTGSTTFTPTAADGTVEVTFTVPTGYAGDALVAFEYLYEGATAEGEPVAEHTDIEDAAQTVTVDEEPVVVVPSIGTSLVDSADDDHNLVWNGGTVIDTVAYQNLTPGTEYTVSGELMLQADGSATGITGSTTFTPTEANGTVDVTFIVPTGFAGDALVAYEHLYEGSSAEGEPVAEHTDIEDAAQTVTVDEEPVVTVPSIGTSLVDDADQDHTLAWDGGTVIDTIAYQNLTPGTEYTVTGELMNKADGSGTGITGTVTFTPTEADGTVSVAFAVPSGYAGESLVAFEYIFEGSVAEGEPVAEHTDIEDAAQTVTVEEQPTTPTVPGGDGGLAITGAVLPVGLVTLGALALVAGILLVRARRKENALS